MKLLRGAQPSPRHRLAAAEPHKPVPAPPQFITVPKQLSMWGNDTYGDCCTAEEAFAKACHSPEIFISDTYVIRWATNNGVLNGAQLTTVLDRMKKRGFRSTYDDGPATSVNWTDPATLQSAIYQGPVKIGIAADQLEAVCNAYPGFPANGWIATKFQKDANEDHCVSLCGYGTTGWLATQLHAPILPTDVDMEAPGYAMFTWSSIGVIDVPSMLAITGEAWLRNPTTVVK